MVLAAGETQAARVATAVAFLSTPCVTRSKTRAPGPTLFLRSPLGRVHETSDIIGRELGLEPAAWRDDPRLAELSYGQWEGFSWKEIEVTHPERGRMILDRLAEELAELAIDV